MRNIILCLSITLLTLGLTVTEASAKRFGGGRSFGVQRSQSSFFSQQNTRSSGIQHNKHRWGGILGGLLAGSLLASLFMGHGFGGGLLSLLIIGALAFFLLGFLRKKIQHGFQPMHATPIGQNRTYQQANFFTAANEGVSGNYPDGFQTEPFLRDAKVKFIRLQAAYDQKNRKDLAEFTTPEVYAEIEMQLEERGDAPNKTDIIHLETQLLDVSRQADSIMASVRFTGSIQENDDPIIALDEIWHFRQFRGNSAWVIGGIQQDVTAHSI